MELIRISNNEVHIDCDDFRLSLSLNIDTYLIKILDMKNIRFTGFKGETKDWLKINCTELKNFLMETNRILDKSCYKEFFIENDYALLMNTNKHIIGLVSRGDYMNCYISSKDDKTWSVKSEVFAYDN